MPKQLILSRAEAFILNTDIEQMHYKNKHVRLWDCPKLKFVCILPLNWLPIPITETLILSLFNTNALPLFYQNTNNNNSKKLIFME